MPPGPDISPPELPPQRPETAQEAPPEAGTAFEAPKTAAERPAEAEAAPPPTVPSTDIGAVQKDETTVRVENVLEEDLRETYLKMPPDLRERFKAHGERVAREIVGMLRSLKIKADRILDLIRGWLKTIPGVNRFFLVQEAKIKTDKILALAEEEKKKRGLV